jgi:SAM-dependent methyltransferase
MPSPFYFRAIRKAFRIATGPIKRYQTSQAVRRLQHSHPDTPDYPHYLQMQIEQTRGKTTKDASFRLVPFVELVRQHCTNLSPNSSILCIGPRNETEVNVFEERGFQNVTAIDLWSSSPRIMSQDMHQLQFKDDSFDLIFASHVLEHAYDFERVARECTRVLRDGGYIFCAVPINYETGEFDRHDFKNPEGLLHHFSPHQDNILVQDVHPDEMILLFTLKKQPGPHDSEDRAHTDKETS